MTTKIYHSKTTNEPGYTDLDLDLDIGNITISSAALTSSGSTGFGYDYIIDDAGLNFDVSSIGKMGGYTWTNASTASPVWSTTTIGGGGGGGGGIYNVNPTGAGKVQINGQGIEMSEDADITFGDMSLKGMLKELADRLNVLVPDTKLEKEYEELRQAREHYDYVREKLRMLEKLKNTPVEPKI